MDSQNKDAKLYTIAFLESRANEIDADADKQEAIAQAAFESAKSGRAASAHFKEAAQKLKAEIGVVESVPISEANGAKIDSVAKAAKTVQFRKVQGNRFPPLVEMIAPILKDNPQGMTKTDVLNELAKRGRTVSPAQLATILSGHDDFVNERISPSIYLWRHVDSLVNGEPVQNSENLNLLNSQ